MSTASVFLADVVQRTSTKEMRDQAIKDHEETTANVERLAEAIRGELQERRKN